MSLHNRERWMQQRPVCGSKMDAFNMVVPEAQLNISLEVRRDTAQRTLAQAEIG